MIRFLKRKLHWIKKSIEYSVFLWTDNDWDFAYILMLLKYKLKRTRENINKNANHVGYENIVAEINTAEQMIQKILDGDFYMKEYEAHEKKWGPRKKDSMIFGERERIMTSEDKKQEEHEIRIIITEMHRQEEQAWSDLFDYLKEHMRNWWD